MACVYIHLYQKSRKDKLKSATEKKQVTKTLKKQMSLINPVTLFPHMIDGQHLCKDN